MLHNRKTKWCKSTKYSTIITRDRPKPGLSRVFQPIVKSSSAAAAVTRDYTKLKRLFFVCDFHLAPFKSRGLCIGEKTKF